MKTNTLLFPRYRKPIDKSLKTKNSQVLWNIRTEYKASNIFDINFLKLKMQNKRSKKHIVTYPDHLQEEQQQIGMWLQRQRR
jgi:hypothetical protein